jgi:phage shock protein PspC (stress-responsive transcriptional regulator)
MDSLNPDERIFMIDEKNESDRSEEKLFDKMANEPAPVPLKKLQRSKNNVVIAGVCSGIAEYLNMDVANVRVIALLTILLGGWGAIAYVITSLLLPAEQTSKQLTDTEFNSLRKENFRTVLSGLLILTGLHFAFVYIGFGSGERIFLLPNGLVFPFVSIAFGIILLRKNGSKNVEPDIRNSKNYFRSRTDRRIMGVCGGLSRYLNLDSSALRIIFTIATLLTLGIFAVVYIYFSLFTSYEMEKKLD